MNFNSIITFIFSIWGIFLFFKLFREVRTYASILAELFGIVGILFLSTLLANYFLFQMPIDFNQILIFLIGLIRNTLLASVAIHYFKKNHHTSAPILIDKNFILLKSIKYYKPVLLYFILLLIISVIILTLSGTPVIKIKQIPFSLLIVFFLDSIVIAVMEESFTRLFLIGLLYNFFRKIKFGYTVSIIISSLIWSSDHFLLEFHFPKFLFVFISGIVLGYLMKYKGIESTIITHSLYNFSAILFLSGF